MARGTVRAVLLLALLATPLGVAPALANQAAGSRNVVEQVKAHSRFTVFARALEATRLGDRLAEGGPYTVFAFTDQAFERLPESFKDHLFSAEGAKTLEQVLGYHVIPGRAMSGDMSGRVYEVATLDGNTLTIEGQMDFIRVNGSTILQPDIMAENGVIHLLDYVIIPPNF
ncbi:MAG: fasciclin domain-containing protein [Alphaproteobacteria bacterium]